MTVSSVGALRRATLVLLLAALIWGSMIPVLGTLAHHYDKWLLSWLRYVLGMPVLWLAVLGSAMQVIYARHKARDLFVHLEKLNAERDSLEMEWGRLQLEQSYWSSHAFVERVANAKLQMNLPQTRDVRIVRP